MIPVTDDPHDVKRVNYHLRLVERRKIRTLDLQFLEKRKFTVRLVDFTHFGAR